MKLKWLLSGLVLIALAAGLVVFFSSKGRSDLGREAYSLTAEIVEFGPRPPGSETLGKVLDHLKKELEGVGWAVVYQEFERGTPIGQVRFRNLRARFKVGDADPWERKIEGLLGAHIDSKYDPDGVFVGADDAASACAGVVVLGQWLAREKPEMAARMELVLFDGEEAFARDMTLLDGLYGSRYYANEWRNRPDKPHFGIILDMVGHKDLRIRLPADTPVKLKDLVFESAKAEGAERFFGMAQGPILDDHVPLNLVGIPTVDIIGDFGRKKWWHTPADNMDIISEESLDISLRVTRRMLLELLK